MVETNITSSFHSIYPHWTFKQDDSHHPHEATDVKEENQSFASYPFSTKATLTEPVVFEILLIGS